MANVTPNQRYSDVERKKRNCIHGDAFSMVISHSIGELYRDEHRIMESFA